MIAIDTETYDPDLKEKGPGVRRDGYVAGLAIGTDGGERFYLPMRHKLGGNLAPEHVLSWAKINLTRPNQPKVGANLLYDLDYLEQEGVKVEGPFHDVQIAEPLLDENKMSYALEVLGMEYLAEGKKDGALYQWCADSYGGKTTREGQATNIWRAPTTLVGPYAEGDVDLPLRIIGLQREELEKQGLTELFTLESELMPMVLAMRRRGVRVNVEAAEKFHETATAEIKRITADLGHINVNAGEDLVRLCKKEGIQYPTTDKGNPSFRKDWLLHNPHPKMRQVSEVRTLMKLRDTFVKGYILGCNINGRIHCSFNQLRSDDSGTVSGRFSSSDPNLQNIPTRTAMGKAIRAMFLPEEDEIWGRFDWSQIEYRLLTHYAMGTGSEEARETYRSKPDTDFHQMTCNLLNRLVSIDRSAAKNINFGLCIAKGQRVLTQVGLIPIEQIKCCHLLWDGIQWVTHRGLIYKGKKPVITYDGLTGTKDHGVWTQSGRPIPLGRAASEGHPLARTGRETEPLKSPFDYPAGDLQEGKRFSYYRRVLSFLRNYEAIPCGQPALKKNKGMSLQEDKKQIQQPLLKDTGRQIRRNDSAVQYRYTRLKSSIQRSWDKGIVRIKRGLHFLGFGEISKHGLQEPRLRQKGQQWPLREEQPAPCNKECESLEQVDVYDILDAGPRHRFTCEDVLVHNCYGMGHELLASILGLGGEQAQSLIDAYHKGVPFVRYTANMASKRAQKREYIHTLLGRRRRFPGGNFTHKALNALLQGGNADIMKKAMVMIWKSGVCDVLGAPLLTVHDELDWSVPKTAIAEEAMREVHHIMETCVTIKVPIIAAREEGVDWGHLKKVIRGY